MVTSPKSPAGGLLGRDQEMAVLLGAVEAAREGRPSTVLVGGDAGIGKTRLLTEFVHRSAARVLWGGCLPLGERGVPYLAVIEMLRALDEADRVLLPPTLELLAPKGRKVTTKPTVSRAHLFQSVLSFLEDLASEEPLIAVVEDLHWADRSTRDLLDFLIGLLRDQRILLVVSFRTDDLPTDHPLRLQLAEWLRRPSVVRLDLTPLSPEDGLRLIAPLLADSGATEEQARRLVERADGNPFYLEVLAAAGPDMTSAPGPMRDLLLRRTHDLSPDLLRLLRIASVGGTTIDEDLLSHVAGLDIERTRELLRRAIEVQLLTLDDHGCRFRHALLAEALHDDLLPAERREYHAAYADGLLALPGPVPPAELASHLAEAGRIDEALAAFVAAGEAAEAQLAFAEARDGYMSAADLWDLVDDPSGAAGLTRVDLLRRLAEAAFLAGDPEVARNTISGALDEVDPDEEPVVAGLMYDRLARYLRNTDDFGDALAFQERAVELIPPEPPSREGAEVLSGLALIHQYENRYHEARELSTKAIEVAVETGAIEAEIRARNTLGETVCILEDLDRGLAMIGEALDLARRTESGHEQARALWNIQANRFFGGRLVEFVENAESTIATLRTTQPHWIVDHMVDTADALQMLGRWGEADATLAEARHLYPTVASRIGIRELLVARRRLDEARALVDEQTELLVGYVGPDVTGRVWNLVNQADVELADGRPERAIELIDQALARYPHLDKPTYICHGVAIALRAAADLARTARNRGDDRSLEKSIEIGERLHQRMADEMALPGPEDGWRREVGSLFAQCEAEWSRLHGRPDPEAWLTAAERWSALSMPVRASYCRVRWAEDALASGADRKVVEIELRRLFDFLANLGARLLEDEVRALARRARIDVGDRYGRDPYGLTEREREVLTQLTRGATNRQIGEALFISEKTASVHVSNILRKLAAANRGEAAATAIKDGLVDMTELSRGP
jgi:DNA-binding CsgD family transcriptional regulator/tetratricopeptide (TPR) repeat protein